LNFRINRRVEKAACRAVKKSQIMLSWRKMGSGVVFTYRIFGLVTIGLMVVTNPAFAGFSNPAPGPVAGIGLPALALIGGAYWIGRKLVGKK
jgi:hypothetical protein